MDKWRPLVARRLARLAFCGQGGRAGGPVSIILPAFAKVNLALEVGPRLVDGYHRLRTVFQAVSLCDVVSLRCCPQLVVNCSYPGVPQGEANLAYRAACFLRELLAHEEKHLRAERFSPARRSRPPGGRGTGTGVCVDLYKAIPPAAGLGGGSSDAATTLRGLTWLWHAEVAAGEMMQLAARLGSDVPFFLTGGTALGEGRGDVCRPLPDLPPCVLVVAWPPRQVATVEVYSLWDASAPPAVPAGKGVDAVREALLRSDLAGVAGALWNDLRPVTERMVPEVGELRELLVAAGALGAEMSGSGPAVFGIFSSFPAAREVLVALRGRGYRAFVCRPVGQWSLYPGGGESG
jgi:4-diphosphocytidyl-2-C-methyl-D-erythritol kinase